MIEAVGDPEAMRALAAELNSRADQVRTAHRLPIATLDAATFEGPAATSTRSTASDLALRASQCCADLESTAQALLAGARTVEARNAELQRAADAAHQDADGAPDTPASQEPAA